MNSCSHRSVFVTATYFFYPKSVIRKSFLSFSNDRFGFMEEESEEDLNLSISSCRSASGVLLEIATALMPFSR